MNPFLVSVLVCSGLCLVQLVAAIPWLFMVDQKAVGSQLRRPLSWLLALVAVVVAGALLAWLVGLILDPTRLITWGRVFGAILNAQLIVDFFIILFPVLMVLWPQGAAVALAAFREGVRQPMFWLITAVAFGWMVFSPFLPYFTFGEDFKVVRELGYDTIMLLAVLFSVLASAMSISEEIEGRSAITVMSKPVSRRQFLLGKFIGTLLAALLMTAMLGWVFNGVMWFKLWFDNEQVGLPAWVEANRVSTWGASLGEAPLNFALGMGVWFDTVVAALPGLILGFCQVTVLLAIAVALATRLPMVVNLVICLLIFFLGHLTHILVLASHGRYALINFMARLFDHILPGLEYFDLGPIIVRDTQPDPRMFWFYIGSVCLYAVLYSVIALLFGLILFEDRDLA
jgi:hypothetical protein